MEMQMMERGYLDDRKMANMFNLLRSSELIWANVINNYLLGQKPPALDMLYWNSDGTRMARDAHSFYIRNTYLENNLIKPGEVELMGRPIDLGRITGDVYAVGAEKDHIVPWKSAWRISKLANTNTTHFTLAASGHIAGMIAPPEKGKGYWTSEDGQYETAEEWRENAEKHEGTWWEDWRGWLEQRSGEQIDPPRVGSEQYPPIENAPGTYVRETSAETVREAGQDGAQASSQVGQQGVEFAQEGARAAQRVITGVQIEGYDEMNVGEVVMRLDNLSAEELQRVRAYEQRNKNRGTLLKQIDRRINAAS
jgi:hypothetical protein